MSTTTFEYQVRDTLGRTLDGVIEAANLEEAQQTLRRDGYEILEIEEESGGLSWLAPSVSQSDIIFATSQLAVMVDTGITLSAALGGIAEQEQNPALKKVLGELKEQVESGNDFSAALAAHPQHFDTTYVSLIKASEHTGTMGEMLDTISDHLRKQLETRHKVRAALAYPAVMLVVAVSVTIFLLTFVLPKFQPLFLRKNIQLPIMTKIMMSGSHLLLDYWPCWIAGAVGLLVAYLVGRRTDRGRQILDSLAIHTPILGPICRKVIISRCLRTLATMISAGVSMLDAIQLAAEVSGNHHYRNLWNEVLEQITQGNRICEALSRGKLFPPTLVQMISAGEETGKLDLVLKKISNYYDRDVETSLKAATSLIEPLMIVVMGLVVGSIAMGLLLPIFSLSKPG